MWPEGTEEELVSDSVRSHISEMTLAFILNRIGTHWRVSEED